MSYFIFGKADLQRLADAYEAYCDEIGQTYYNVDEDKATELWRKIEKMKEELDLD